MTENIERLDTKKIHYIEIAVYIDGNYDYSENFTGSDLKNVYWKGTFLVIESIRGTFIFSPLSSGLIEIYYEGQEIQSYEDKKRK